jgi:hypothetical protein
MFCPFYRDRIFPLAEAAGFVPVAAADVINLGDSVSAKIDTLIDRAAVMVVYLSTPWTHAELGLAVARAKQNVDQPNRLRLRLIPVITDFEQLPVWAMDFQALRRSDLLSDESEQFVQELADIFSAVAGELGIALNFEPRRLYEAKEFRTAVIAAMTLMEATLLQRLNKSPVQEFQRVMSVQQLLSRVTDDDIHPVPREEILGWIRLRNQVVHSAKLLTKNEARAVVKGAERILGIQQ